MQTNATKRFKTDQEANKQLSQSLKLSDLNESDYDAIFYPGGHGPLWDLVSDENSIRLIKDFWNAGKPVSAVCHAPIVLANVKDSSGEFIIKGLEVTGFTNSEEDAVQLTNIVPLLVEDTMIDRGAKYLKSSDWSVHTIQDKNLITGQNPASSEEVANLVLKALTK